MAEIVQAVGSLLPPAIQCCQTIYGCLKRNYGYMKHMKKNFDELEEKVCNLCDEKKKVADELNNNKSKMTESAGCKLWRSNVEAKINEFEALKKKYQQIDVCLCGIPFQWNLGRKMVAMIKEVVSLRNQIDNLTKMLQKPADPFISRHVRDIKEVPSLNEHLEVLKEHLGDVNVKKLCIWGPPRVGKTTIMENLHNAVAKDFDFLFWVPEITGRNIEDIQAIVLKRLCLSQEAEILNDNHERGHKISEKLKDKKYVLFLDGVSSNVDLHEIGISDEHKNSKVVFTCRSKDICGQADVFVNVEKLSNTDAQELFWEAVGVDYKRNRHIQPIADLIINECGGMPYLLTLIGKNLKTKRSPSLWRAALNDLRSPSMEPRQELVEIDKFFEFVYKELRSDMQPCVLYWAVFPAGYELHQDYIIEYWRAEQFLKQSEKLCVARDSGHAILNQLVEKSLLLKGKEMDHYKMFEYFQRAASRMAYCMENSCRILVKEREKIREEEWEKANRLSLIRLSLSTLPQRPNCCRILTLLLQESIFAEFPPAFFGYMCGLQLLDLRHTHIRLLPPSISSLINLNALFLNNCRLLTQLPSEIADLQKLEILDARHTAIRCLPTEIGELINLKCLRVSFVEIVGNDNDVDAGVEEMISSGIISGLHALEELIIEIPDPTIGRWMNNVESIAGAVADLEELTTLSFYFPEVECFKTFIKGSKSWNRNNTLWGRNSFRSFKILVGNHQTSGPCTKFDVSGCSAERHFRFSAGEGFPEEVLMLLEQAYSFQLIGHKDAAKLSNFVTDKLGGLEACIIEDCAEMTSIIDGNQAGGVAFQGLNMLHITNLPKLMHIWEGSIRSGSLNKLITLTVKKCGSIKTLFSEELVRQLSQLRDLQVEDCEKIQEIIKGGSNVDSGAFPKLKTLTLINCQELSTICNNIASLEWPFLERITIKTCLKLNSFPSTFKKAAKLKEIVCAESWLLQLDWQDDTSTRDHFLSLHRPDQ